jgi:hydrogenase expression/formation protein HypC
MCLAMPGKILKIDGDTATISYPGQKRQAKIIEGEYSVGDYVFVSAQIIVQKLPKEEALQSLKAWGEAFKNAP